MACDEGEAARLREVIEARQSFGHALVFEQVLEGSALGERMVGHREVVEKHDSTSFREETCQFPKHVEEVVCADPLDGAGDEWRCDGS